MNKHPIGKYTFLLFSAAIAVWIIVRGINLSITNDEAFSFYNISTLNIKMMYGTANTHWLNSVFMLIEMTLFGSKEWMIRIHSFIAFIIFVWGLYKFSLQHIRYTWQLLVALSLVLLNIYMLDFFSIARGYGLSIALEMLAIYSIIRKDDIRNSRFTIYLLLAAATFSCYTCIFLLFAFYIYDLAELVSGGQIKRLASKHFHYSCMPLYCVSIFAIPNILFVRHIGDLEEGQRNGLIADSFGVFFERSFPSISGANIIWLVCFVLYIGVVTFYVIFNTKMHKSMRALFQLFFINILLIEFVFYVFHIPYVFGRTALSINLLFWLLLLYMLQLAINIIPSKINLFICLTLLSFSIANLIINKNPRTTVEWWKTQDLDKCIADLVDIEGKNVINKKIGMHLAQYGAYQNYYKVLRKYPLNDTVYSFCENSYGILDSSAVKQIYAQDYVIMINPYNNHLDEKQYTVIKYYKDMNSDLIRIHK